MVQECEGPQDMVRKRSTSGLAGHNGQAPESIEFLQIGNLLVRNQGAAPEKSGAVFCCPEANETWDQILISNIRR